MCERDGQHLGLAGHTFGVNEPRAEPGRQGGEVMPAVLCLSHLTIIAKRGYGPPWGRVGPLRLHASAALPEQKKLPARKHAGKNVEQKPCRASKTLWEFLPVSRCGGALTPVLDD